VYLQPDIQAATVRRPVPAHPNVPEPGKTGPGGGRVGAVLLSPLIRRGTVSAVDYNHYSLLRTVEDIFGLTHLGDAAMPQVRSFEPDIFR
jgi:phosphatidylinositol-3-phosphatase